MNRRAFLTTVSLALLLEPPASHAQQSKVFRVATLWPEGAARAYVQIFVDAMRALGYVKGDNLVIDDRSGPPSELPAIASELVRSHVDVIHAASSPAVRAAMQATRKIPVVALDLETDPVASGFAESIIHPGGNLTGFFLNFPELSAKRLELLKETLPTVSRVAVLWDSSMDPAPLTGMDSAARALKLRTYRLELGEEFDLESAFNDIDKLRAGVVLIMQSPRLDGNKGRILKLAARRRLPVMALFAHYAADGALLSYGPVGLDMIASSAAYVDKVLKGAKPGDLPIQRTVRFELVINMTTAKRLAIEIPQSVLVRADQLIREGSDRPLMDVPQ